MSFFEVVPTHSFSEYVSVTESAIRLERIEHLLKDLRYEVERGVVEQEINETLSYRFYVPISRVIPGGVVFCEFRTRPVLSKSQPRLKLVE
jgi:hypothetical protein